MAIPSFRASIKNPDVEEPIDLLVHRPLGYLVARALFPTSVSADAVTIASMFVGMGSGVASYMAAFTRVPHNFVAGALLVASAVLDCADGQLARMRQRATRYGRMLDGLVDAVVQAAAMPAALLYMVVRRGGFLQPAAIAWLAGGVLAILAGIRHMALYDHFKNVYARNTDPAPRDCDDLDQVRAEWERLRASGPVGLFGTVRWKLYIFHLENVAATVRFIDPHVPRRFADMPAYTPERAARFRALHRGLMRAWSFFGIGTHIFVIAVFMMLDFLEGYVVLRLVGFNLLLVVLAPLQRRASREFFATPAP